VAISFAHILGSRGRRQRSFNSGLVYSRPSNKATEKMVSLKGASGVEGTPPVKLLGPPVGSLKGSRVYSEQFLHAEPAGDCSTLCVQRRGSISTMSFNFKTYLPKEGIKVLPVCSCCFEANQHCSLCKCIDDGAREISSEDASIWHLKVFSVSPLINDYYIPPESRDSFRETYGELERGLGVIMALQYEQQIPEIKGHITWAISEFDCAYEPTT
jgi:hypothetical protein